jgi:acyl-CoA synthetase (NDP forming)
VPAVLNEEMKSILSASREAGWVVEPEAKKMLSLSGLEVPRFRWAREPDKAVSFAKEIGYPVVAKVVSPKILHKSERHGVAVGLDSDEAVRKTYKRFSEFEAFYGMLVEEMVPGLELIVGAKVDYQFGPVILLGIGGTGVEIYKDSAIRMAPLQEGDVPSMVKALKAHVLLEGYRGSKPINLKELTRMMIAFSGLVMDLQEEIESIDLNPVKCTSETCVIADARIMLTRQRSKGEA